MACRAASVLAILGLAFLSGCSWFGDSKESTERPAASCPTTSVLKPLSQTAVFAPGATHQPIGVAFYGVLSDVTAKCDRSGDVLHLSLDVIVIGERGPASAQGAGVDLQYFVAVTGSDQSILSKRSLPVHIAIPAAARRAGITDHVEETVSLAGKAPGDLNIVLGFQQPPDVVEFYRHFHGR
ncbi:MAG TPA: hypothetical protein VHY35_05110 [Stellaceae bacterium]|nr:hypothetical protein [Stellaceae bacterium]